MLAGLDVGAGAVKAVVITISDGIPEVRAVRLLRCQAEGFVDEEDVIAHLPAWLTEAGLTDVETVGGITQDVATIQIVDFPPSPPETLDELVAFQTRQLADLSEDSLIHDYTAMPATDDRPMPVLIGVCLVSVVRDWTEKLTAAGVRLADLAMNGLAVVNACFQLRPESRVETSPQIILDIGQTSSTFAVAGCGQAWFVCTLMFGVEKLSAALAAKWGVALAEVPYSDRNYRIPRADENDPLGQAAASLIAEIRSALEQWREHDPRATASPPVTLYLSGGGALFAGLPEYLAEVLDCEVRVVAPPVPGKQEEAPLYATAYGLALQAAGLAKLPTSLALPATKWVARRRRRTGVLVAAVSALLLFLAAAFVGNYLRLTRQKSMLVTTRKELSRCEGVIRNLDEMQARVQALEKMAMPLVEHASRARRYAATLQQLSEARETDDWFVYVGDVNTFEEGKQAALPETAAGPSRTHEPPSLSAFAFADPRAPAKTIAETTVAPLPAWEVKPLRGMVVAGYATLEDEEAYQPVRELVSRLNRGDLFAGVDLLPASELRGREDVWSHWPQALLDVSVRANRAEARFKPFVLKLPFAQQIINTETDDQ